GPCLRCIFPQPPDPRELPTCDTAGVLGPVAAIVASLQATIAIKLLSGNEAAVSEEMLNIDLWTNRFRSVSIAEAKKEHCPCCGKRQFQFLNATNGTSPARLCGRNAVQIRPGLAQMPLKEIADRLGLAGQVELTPFMVRCKLGEGDLSLTAFED